MQFQLIDADTGDAHLVRDHLVLDLVTDEDCYFAEELAGEALGDWLRVLEVHVGERPDGPVAGRRLLVGTRQGWCLLRAICWRDILEAVHSRALIAAAWRHLLIALFGTAPAALPAVVEAPRELAAPPMRATPHLTHAPPRRLPPITAGSRAA
jgi:hypothetical protein